MAKAFVRTLKKNQRLEEMQEDEVKFVDLIQGKADYLQPVLGFCKQQGIADIQGDVDCVSKSGQDDDFKGSDFDITDTQSVLKCQDKQRQRNQSSSHPRSGLDCPVEIARIYYVGDTPQTLKMFADKGRDIAPIPTGPVSLNSETGFVDRDETLHESDLYVVHPAGKDHVCWCDSKEVKAKAAKLMDRFFEEFQKGDEFTMRRLRSLLKNGTDFHTLDCFDEEPLVQSEKIELRGLVEENDTKSYTLDGGEVSSNKARIAKINAYIPFARLKHIKTKELKE